MSSDQTRTSDIMDAQDEVLLHASMSEGQRFVRATVTRLLPDGLVVAIPADALDLTNSLEPYEVLVTRPAVSGAFAAEMTRVVSDHPTGRILTLRQHGGWRRIQRRDDVRLPTSLDARLHFQDKEGEQKSVKVTILDISAGGMLVQSKEGLAPGDGVRVTFEIPGQPMPLTAAAQVVRVITPDEIGWGIFRMGLRFSALAQRDEDRIVAFIFKEQGKAKRLTADPRRHI